MNPREITKAMEELNDWVLDNNTLTKEFEFKDFNEALNFINKIGKIAEEQNHHPDIIIRYNKVKLSLTTHSSQEITEKDFALAKEIDSIN